MNFTKKQVKALLEVLSKDSTRPVLTMAKVDKHGDTTVLVATDGYILAEIAAPELDEHIGMFVRRDELTKWYKLAGSRDVLDASKIIAMLTDTDENYPDWQKNLLDKLNPEPIESITVNPKFLVIMNDLAGANLTWQFNGRNGALKSELNGNTYVVMPLKS